MLLQILVCFNVLENYTWQGIDEDEFVARWLDKHGQA
jgi:hypothetical protein